MAPPALGLALRDWLGILGRIVTAACTVVPALVIAAVMAADPAFRRTPGGLLMIWVLLTIGLVAAVILLQFPAFHRRRIAAQPRGSTDFADAVLRYVRRRIATFATAGFWGLVFNSLMLLVPLAAKVAPRKGWLLTVLVLLVTSGASLRLLSTELRYWRFLRSLDAEHTDARLAHVEEILGREDLRDPVLLAIAGRVESIAAGGADGGGG